MMRNSGHLLQDAHVSDPEFFNIQDLHAFRAFLFIHVLWLVACVVLFLWLRLDLTHDQII